MTGTIENGERLDVAFGPYEGKAGICDRGEGLRDVAMFADHRKLRNVTQGTIAGEPVEVLAIERSEFVRGMVVLTVRPI